jgi:general secretion pathway protein F
MAVFEYKAVDATGTSHAGRLESTSRSDALTQLAQRQLIPIDLHTPRASGPASTRLTLRLTRSSGARRSPMKLADLGRFVQSLSILLNANLTVDRAMRTVVVTSSDPVASDLARFLEQSVRSGKSLTGAFQASEVRLPSYFLSMVRVGEMSGTLGTSMKHLAELIQREVDTAETIRSALTYPILLSTVVLVTLVALLAFVLPRFELLFADASDALPSSTRAVLWMGRFIAETWWMLLGAFAAALMCTTIWLRSASGKLVFHRWLVASPLFQELPAAIQTARFMRTLGTLLAAGSTLPDALGIARTALSNVALRAAMDSVLTSVRAGQSFAHLFAQTRLFPGIAAQLLQVGEESGRLDELAISVADVLDQEAQRRIQRLLALIVPITIVIMGCVVATLIGSVLVGLLSINDLAF